MAHKKAGGSTSLGRDSKAKRLGVKRHDGNLVKPGMIIVRQRGSKIRAGVGVKKGKDDTLYAARAGKVKFSSKKLKKFNGRLETTKFVQII
ncbi:MAG: 50S ribosomal protein L27 [Candidatus Komeilibacteria bacterium]|nr:50S ribosomal protein L27 [Candidatus Komeilibacteria bacterium]